jgi:hypothetical protein
MVRRTRPGISRFRVRCFASLRNDGWKIAPIRAAIFHTTPNPLCCPTGKSRMISVESYARKYSSSRFPQITHTTPPSRPTRGAYPDRQKRGAGCGGRGSVGVNGDGRAGFACERSPSCRRTAPQPGGAFRRRQVAAYGKTVWAWHPLLMSSWRRFVESDRASMNR